MRRPRLVRLGSHHGPPEDEARAAAVEALAALRVGDLLAHDELSCGQLARRLAADPGPLADVLDEAEGLGLVRSRDSRYSLTPDGRKLLPSRRQSATPRQRRTTLAW